MGERGQYFFENREKGRWFSKYGVLNTLMYVPPLLAERLATGSLPWISPARLAFLNAFNLVLALFSAAYLLATVALYTRDTAVKWVTPSRSTRRSGWNYCAAQASESHTIFVHRALLNLSGSRAGSAGADMVLATLYMAAL